MVPGLCEGTAGEAVAVAEGAAAGPTAGLLEPLLVAIDQRFSAAGLDGRSAGSAGVGGPSACGAANGQRGRTSRSPDFEPLMARMREVLDYDSEAVW